MNALLIIINHIFNSFLLLSPTAITYILNKNKLLYLLCFIEKANFVLNTSQCIIIVAINDSKKLYNELREKFSIV